MTRINNLKNLKTLMAVAAYIDLNPVRAGMADRPEDYPWSGYGEAASKGRGAKRARMGLGTILREALGLRGQDAAACGEDWRRTLGRYRLFLYERGEERASDPQTGEGGRLGIPPEQVAELHGERAGELAPIDDPGYAELEGLASSLEASLRRRVRYFTDGAVFGTAAFVEAVFSRARKSGGVSPKRRSGARSLRGADWGPLRVLRDLQKGV